METNELILLAFGIVAGLQLLYWGLIFPRFAFKKKHETGTEKQLPPISVIVVGRNEQENFGKNLEPMLLQDYPDFEVVAVNDQSTDDSEHVIEELRKKYKHLKLVRVPENDHFWNGKKYGLTLGIKAASHEHLLFTDADCRPAGPRWIRGMASGFMDQRDLVLGFGNISKAGGFVNFLSRFEAVQTAIQYFSLAFWKMPYMGVGRNLAYKKSLWMGQNGFIRHIHVPSGDDDLFVNSVSKIARVGVVARRDAHTFSDSKITWKDWVRQKRRHFSTARHYRKGHQLVLGLFGLTTLLFWPVALFAVFSLPEYFPWLWIPVALRLVLQWVVGLGSARFLNNRDVVILWPLIEVIWVMAATYIQLVNRLKGKPKRW